MSDKITSFIFVFAMVLIFLWFGYKCLVINAISTDAKENKNTIAFIKCPNGDIIHGEVDSHTNYGNGIFDIKIKGKRYLTHMSNVILIEEE